MEPAAEHVHWMFATGFLVLGVMLLAEAIVGEEVWRRARGAPYLWPSTLFVMGVLMWPVMVFFTSSTIHMLAHGSWAQVMMLAGAAELGLVSGKLTTRRGASASRSRSSSRASRCSCTSRTRGSSSARPSSTTSSAGRSSSATVLALVRACARARSRGTAASRSSSS